MKRLLTLCGVILLLALSSCASKVYYTIGMSENDFLNQNRKKVTSIKHTRNYTIYLQGDGYQGSWYFYFINGVLDEVNQGRRSSDFIIENR